MDNIKLQKIYLVVEITDYTYFNKLFPENRVQPSWDYYPIKGVIKIDPLHAVTDEGREAAADAVILQS